MKVIAVLLALACLSACGGGNSSSALASLPPTPSSTPAPTPTPALKLVWSDEFNGAAGSPVDNTKWTSDVGGDGWGNSELEYYTNATDPTQPNYTTANAYQDGSGNLVISARAESVGYSTCWYGACAYTSARLTTLGKFSQAYGHFEARMKIPPGQGLWPAFWMMGSDINTAGYPNCGEIDVMEAIGSAPSSVYGSAHGPGFSGADISGGYTLPSGVLSSDYHVYAVDWMPGQLRYSIDGVPYETITQSMLTSSETWEFNKAFFLLLNLAVGGNWPGSPDASTSFPANLYIDYVRVYTNS